MWRGDILLGKGPPQPGYLESKIHLLARRRRWVKLWRRVVGPVNTTVFKELELASVVLKGFFAFQQKLSLHRNTGLVTKIEIEKREIRI